MSTRAEGRIWTVFRRLARDERGSRIKNRRHAPEKMLLWIKRNLPLRRTPERMLGPSEINHFESGEINQNRSNKKRQFDSCYFMKAPK